MDRFVIDVSHHNGRIDWDKVKATGAHAIIRCGYGMDKASQDDRQWARNIAEVERLGIPHGVYFYSYATTDAAIESEIAHCLRLVRGHELQYPVYFDSEQPGTQGRACEFANRFCDAMEKAGFWAGVYASDSWFKSYLAGLGSYTKWVARYSSNPPSTPCDMWQYSSKGACDGVPATGEGGIDVNRCYRDFPAEIGGTASAEQPAQEQPAKAEEIAVDGKWGKATTRKLQEVLGTPVDGIVSNQRYKYKQNGTLMNCGYGSWEWSAPGGSAVIKAVQRACGMPASKRDGVAGPVTIGYLQRHLGVKADRKCGPDTVKALQERLKAGWF